MDGAHVVTARWHRSDPAKYQGLLRKLDQPGSALEHTMRGVDRRQLGTYFEALIRTWIDALPPTRLTASNWQVYAGENTLGEFDLIFERNTRVFHWELALKFYLGHPAPDGQFRWYGTNPTDRLDRKWAKMRGHQLRLPRHPAGQGALQVLGIDEAVTSRAFIKGYLFTPLDDSFAVEYPPDINPAAPRGWWVHLGRLASYKDRLDGDGQRRWLRLPRQRWLSPARIDDGDRLCEFDTLNSILADDRSSLVVGVEETKRGLQEVTRGFVVPDRWPHGDSFPL